MHFRSKSSAVYPHVGLEPIEAHRAQLDAFSRLVQNESEPFGQSLDFSMLPHLCLSAQLEILAANSQARELFCELQNPSGRQVFTDYVASNDQDRFLQLINRVFAEGLPQSLEVTLQTTGRRTRLVELGVSLLLTAGGPAAVLSIVPRDREADLQFQVEGLRKMLLDEFELLLEVSPEGIISAAYAGTESFLGHPASKLEGLSVEEILPGATERIRAGIDSFPLKTAGVRGAPEDVFVNAAQRGGRTFLAARAPRRNAPKGGLSREDFLAMMSHDIRTPMNAILGFASLLAGTGLDAEQQEYLRYITDNGNTLVRLLNDILEFANADSGRIRLEQHPFYLRRAIEEIIAVGALAASEKSIDLYYHLDPSLPKLLVGDVARLTQVLSSLIANAAKFTERGEVGLIVERAGSGDRLSVRFEVVDTGPGISPEVVPRLFEPFRQPNPLVPRADRGTGLGLAIARRVIELMGGEVSLETHPGVGSRFSFTVPLEAAALPAEPEITEARSLKGKHVLIAEATGSQARALSAMLIALGIEPVIYQEGSLEPLDAAVIGIAGPQAEVLFAELESRGIPVIHAVRRPGDVNTREEILKPITEPELVKSLLKLCKAQPPAENWAGGRRALVADDNSDNCRLMGLFLRNLGFETETAVDGEQAVDAMKREHFPIALLDITMPGIDGCKAAGQIRAHEAATRSQPAYLIAVTAHSLPGDRRKFLQCGMDDYLAKPISEPELRAVMRRAAERLGHLPIV